MKLTVRLLVALAIMAGGVSTASAQKGKPLYTFPFGVQAYTFRKSFPKGVAETLDTIKSMGITEIEGSGGNMPPEEFKKLCQDRGISIPGTGTSYESLVKDPQAAAD